MENKGQPQKDKLTEEERKEIENNKYVKNNKIDHLFVLSSYGQCASFLNEILQSEGILPEEHEILAQVSKRRTKWESKGGHWGGIIYGLIHLKLFLKTTGSMSRLLVALAYPLFCFDPSYNFGRIFGTFLVMPKNFNTLLNLRDGKSIHALQTRLFVKRIVYEDLLVKNKKKEGISWANSYVINSVFGKAFKGVRETQNYIYRIAKGDINFNKKKKANKDDDDF
jgi:hypothetical protein